MSGKHPACDLSVEYSGNNITKGDCQKSFHGHLGTHTGLVIAQGEVDAINYLRSWGYRVKDVVIAGGLTRTIIQMEVDGDSKPVANYGKKVISALRGSLRLQFGLMGSVVVGPDIDPYDLEDVMWAMSVRAGFFQDTDALIQAPKFEAEVEAKTPKPGVTPSGMPVRSDPVEWEREAIKRIQEKLD